MKKIMIALAIIGSLFAAVSCNKEKQGENIMSADVTAIENVAAHNPVEVAIILTTNTNWIVQVPEWIESSALWGSGNSIVTFKFDENYVNETTTVRPRTGEIKFSGGGTINGNGVSLIIPVTQFGFTYIDPSEPIGGIPDADEFVKFMKAAAAGNSIKKWTADNGEVVLLDNIDLSEFADYQSLADLSNVINGNNSNSITGPSFGGVFNGNGFKITNFNPVVTLGENKSFGLFHTLDGAEIKNVDIEGTFTVSAEGTADAGVIAGTAVNSKFSNITVRGMIKSEGSTVVKRMAIGGICGYACAVKENNVTFENCTVEAAAEIGHGANDKNGGTGVMYGGITGFATYTKESGRVIIMDCVNNGNMNASCGRCSGIAATANGGTEIQSCTNNGNQVNTNADGRLANIACLIGQDSKLMDCVNNGNLEAMNYADGKGTCGGLAALLNHDSVVISGGANNGVIKSNRNDGKYIGLLVANFSKFTSVENVTVSGGIEIEDKVQEINSGNFEQFIGTCSDANKSKIKGLVWKQPE